MRVWLGDGFNEPVFAVHALTWYLSESERRVMAWVARRVSHWKAWTQPFRKSSWMNWLIPMCFPFHGIPPPRITASMLEIILIPSTSHENDAIGFWYPHVAHRFNVPKVLVHWNYPSQIVVAHFPIVRSHPETLRFSSLFELMYRMKGQLLHSNHLAFKSSSSTFCCISNIGNWVK